MYGYVGVSVYVYVCTKKGKVILRSKEVGTNIEVFKRV